MHKVNRMPVYLVVLAALFLQMTVLGHLRILGSKPDIVLAGVVFFGIFLGPARGFETGIVAGFLTDIFALDYPWMNAFVFGLTGLLAGALGDKMNRESRLTQGLLIFSLTLFSTMLHFAVVSNFSRPMNLRLAELFFRPFIVTAVYTAAVSVPMFSKLIDLFNMREPEETL